MLQVISLVNDSDADTPKEDISILSLGPVYDENGLEVGTVSLIGDDLLLDIPQNIYGLFSFDYTITDGLLESNSASVSVFINPAYGVRIENEDSTLVGSDSNDLLNGGLGEDILEGQGGDDVLVGGLGDDILTGGEGEDLFQWLNMDTSKDRITDFNPSDGDQLDLSALFEDQSTNEMDTLLADLASGDNEGTNGNASIIVTDNGGDAQLTVAKGSDTVIIDFDNTAALDVTKSILDNFKFMICDWSVSIEYLKL